MHPAGKRFGGRTDDPITRRGKAAGLATGLTLLGIGAATVWASWAELTCPYGGPRGRAYCSTTVAVGGLLCIGGLILVAAGAVTIWFVARRPLDPNGGEGWTWGQGALVAVGFLMAAALIRRYSCPPGARLTDIFPLCIGPDYRLAADDHIWTKIGLRAAAPLAGLMVATWPALPWPLTAAVTVTSVGVPFFLIIERSVGFPL